MAELLESIRARLLVLRFSANHARTHREKAEAYLSKVRPMYASYNDLLTALQAKRKQRKALTEERDALPLLAISQKRELTEKIQGLTEEIEELKNEETAILRTFHKEKAMQKMTAHPSKRGAISIQTRKEISDTITAADEAARRHAEREEAFASEYQTEYSHFHEVLSEASTLDPHALADARLAIRPEKEKAAFDEIHKAFPEKLPVFMRHDTIYAVDRDLKNLGLERPLLRMQRSIQDGLEQEPQRRNRGKVEKLQKSR